VASEMCGDYDRRAKVVERGHAKKQKQDLRDTELDLRWWLKRCSVSLV